MAVVWSMFDGSGLGLLEWAKAGHTCLAFNYDDADHGDYCELSARIEHPNIRYINVWIDWYFVELVKRGAFRKPDFIMAFPPCTDLANSGSRAWAKKREEDPDFQIKAMRVARIAEEVANFFDVPYMIENPAGMLSTLWRKPNFYFDPWEYGKYLPESDVHPFFPDIINARDSYPKKTGIWSGNGFVRPAKWAIDVLPGYSEQYKRLGGNSPRTKVIRSLTPRGFARAVFLANSLRILK